MKIASIATVKSKLSEYINESKNGAVIITKNGKATAVLLSVFDDDQLEQIILSQSRILKKILDRSVKQMSLGNKIKHSDFWAKLE
jgi:prevent-host-death family protein